MGLGDGVALSWGGASVEGLLETTVETPLHGCFPGCVISGSRCIGSAAWGLGEDGVAVGWGWGDVWIEGSEL